jgi:hypothetical protein
MKTMNGILTHIFMVNGYTGPPKSMYFLDDHGR